jgi:hypothetical protein
MSRGEWRKIITEQSRYRCIAPRSVSNVATRSKKIHTGRHEQPSATRCSCIAISLVSLVSFAAINLHVTSQRVSIVLSVYFVIDSVRKLLDTP